MAGGEPKCELKVALLLTFLLALISLIIAVLGFKDANANYDNGMMNSNNNNNNNNNWNQPSATNSPSTEAEASFAFNTSATLNDIINRGLLKCGVPSNQAGFAVDDGTGNQIGFDADLCRAIAAAIFGSSSSDGKVEFIPISSASERWNYLLDKTVDVLARVTTFTMERDIYESNSQSGFEFTTPYLYNGLGFGGIPPFGACADAIDTTSSECLNLLICVNQGTTHIEVVRALFPSQNVLPVSSTNDLYINMIDGNCNAIAEEQTGFAEAVVRLQGYTGPYETGVNQYSKEPLSVVTREGDPFWSDFVFWVVESLIAADEQGITQQDAKTFITQTAFGYKYSEMFQNAIAEVGNYGEMYSRHLESIVPRGSLNTINNGSSGLLYAFPYGTLGIVGPSPAHAGTIQEIKRRGHVRCGIAASASFADFNRTTREWSGFDVDFCRALSAAIFDGVDSHVVYHELPATERFKVLANGDVDVLSGVTSKTPERDRKEPTSGGVGFSFSPVIFYDGLSFGGIPPFGDCADRIDVSSANCTQLLICVNDGTTTIARTRELFPESAIVPTLPGRDTVDAFNSKKCNAIGGSAQDISETSVRIAGYTGEYEIGKNRFSKNALAIVNREDDAEFTNFIRWIVYSTFYAEEEGIGRELANTMPQTTLFGPLYRNMLSNIINAVGNYGEIYRRNADTLAPRNGSLNGLNIVPFGSEQFPLLYE